MEIKVRAWDKKEKKMIENVGVFYSDNTAYIYKYTSPALGYTEVFINAKYPDRFVPMLYTNCKDKNGKEIYKDDIVKNDYGQIGRVVFKHGAFVFQWNDNTETYWSADPDSENDIEVIGNIWENPDLLKGGNNANQIKNR